MLARRAVYTLYGNADVCRVHFPTVVVRGALNSENRLQLVNNDVVTIDCRPGDVGLRYLNRPGGPSIVPSRRRWSG